MILPVGKIYKSRFSFMKKTYIFEYGDHAVVLEKEKGEVTCYATNAALSEIYAAMPLGKKHRIRKDQFVAINFSEDIMLIDAKDLLIMVDFGVKKMAVNQPQFQASGSNAWGEDVQLAWRSRFNVMFGLPGEDNELDEKAAGEFWAWFAESEETIVSRLSRGSTDAEEVNWLIRKNLAPVFPFEKETELEFQVGTSEGKNTLFVYHFNKDALKAAAQELGTMMPETLRENWNYITEA